MRVTGAAGAEARHAAAQQELEAILRFWHPASVDRVNGGFLHHLDADGAVLDRHRKELVASSRFVVVYAIGAVRGVADWCADAAREGVAYLWSANRDRAHGGYWWVMRGREPQDRRKLAYGHAFVLLAASMALRAGVEEARPLLDDVLSVLDERFFNGGPLALNEASEDWSTATDYRGQNPNMHLCEAFIAAYEATGDTAHLDRAFAIAEQLVLDRATRLGGFVWENYDSRWEPDFGVHAGPLGTMESADGVMPGHQAEWAKLLGILRRHRDVDWLLPMAVHLDRLAWEHGWAPEGGFVSGLDRDLAVTNPRPSYWSASEAIGSAAVLGAATGNPLYWSQYDRAWRYAEEQLIDHEHGGWFKVPSRAGERTDWRKGDGFDPDYHPANACYEALRSLEGLTAGNNAAATAAEESGHA